MLYGCGGGGFSWVDRDKPWQGLPFSIDREEEHMFLTCVKCELGSGRNIIFWKIQWINGLGISQIAPSLMNFVDPAAKDDFVTTALQEM